MHEDGSVDYPQLRKLIDWHIAEGTDCIGVVGTTGESPTVNVEEHCEIIRVAVEQAAKRVPIMAGCGANSTAEAIELAKFAKKVGADSQLQVVPYYNKPTQEGQYQHFKAIAEATGDLPIVLYNVPGRSVADMLHDTVLRLADARLQPGIGEEGLPVVADRGAGRLGGRRVEMRRQGRIRRRGRRRQRGAAGQQHRQPGGRCEAGKRDQGHASSVTGACDASIIGSPGGGQP